jgi:hypothetical protein
MTQVYFNCSNMRKDFVDRRGAVVDDLAEARDHATRVVQSFTNECGLEDGRDWCCMSATIRAMSSSLCPSLSCAASPIEGRHAARDPSKHYIAGLAAMTFYATAALIGNSVGENNAGDNSERRTISVSRGSSATNGFTIAPACYGSELERSEPRQIFRG